MQLHSFTIDDDVHGAETGAIEVTVSLLDGRKRWCFFIIPAAFHAAGDWIDGTQIRLHYGAPHMIVVSNISTDIIERALRHIDARGDLEVCTRALA